MANPLDIHAQVMSEYLNWLLSFNPTTGDFTQTASATVPTFTWKDLTYKCNYSWKKGRYMNQGGLVITDELVLTLLESIPDPGPQPLDVIQFKGQPMRVQFVDLAAGKFPTLTCWSTARGS